MSRRKDYFDRIRDELHESLTEESTPHQVAASFALGTFITMLPTLGTGLLVFVVLVYLFEWLNKVALLASVLVFNPAVKWGVYALSFVIGFALLGPVEGVSFSGAPSLGDGPKILIRLWLGNLILAVVATALAYPIAYRLADAYYDHELPIVEETVDHVVEELEERDTTAGDDARD